MTLVKISSKGWVVIPSALRKKYRLKPGDNVRVVDYGGVLSLVPLHKDPVKKTAGLLKGNSSLTKALLDEHAQEVAREQ